LQAVEESPDAFRGTLDRESAEANEWWIRLIANTAEHPHGLLLVAEVGSDPAGMLFGRLDGEAEVLDVGSMWVDPPLRRRGVGEGLINAALDWARDAGASRAELWVTSGNLAAEELFAKVGFVATDETEPLREGSELRVVKLSAEI
jgi:GNAT superfamily N-acetyltransferase